MGTKTNFAIVCPAGLPPAPSHRLALLSARRCKPQAPRRPTAQPWTQSLCGPPPGGRRGWLRRGQTPPSWRTRPGHAPCPAPGPRGNVVGPGPDPAPPTRPPVLPPSPALRGVGPSLAPPLPVMASLIQPGSSAPGPASSTLSSAPGGGLPPNLARRARAPGWWGAPTQRCLTVPPLLGLPQLSPPPTPQTLPPPRLGHDLLSAYPSPPGRGAPSPGTPFPASAPP